MVTVPINKKRKCSKEVNNGQKEINGLLYAWQSDLEFHQLKHMEYAPKLKLSFPHSTVSPLITISSFFTFVLLQYFTKVLIAIKMCLNRIMKQNASQIFFFAFSFILQIMSQSKVNGFVTNTTSFCNKFNVVKKIGQ